MPANLVLIPLEGVSQTLFWQYREAMPILWELSTRSAMFSRFYAASTSAFQSFCDVAFGDSTELDHNPRFPDRPGCLAGQSTNLFAILREKGYAALGVQHGSAETDYAANNFWGAWPDSCGRFRRHGDYDSFFAESESFLDRAKADGTPFVLYYSDRAARSDDASPEKDETPLYHERFAKGFSLLDRSVGRLMNKLASLNLVADTIVVAYGPYGMDPWKHGVYRGRTMGIDPYADLCWTPMFIFNNNADICVAGQLISAIDLKPTLLHMLFPREEQPGARNILAGVDILRFRRQTALTQSMFALERENEGPSLGMAKSYAATDGEQRLIVTSTGGVPGDGGMELFFDARDPGNTRNFLDFFILNDDGYMTTFGKKDIVHVHFTQSFKPNLVMSIVDSYNQMRGQLYEFVRFKERGALARAGAGGAQFPDDAFKRKRKWK